MAKVNRRPNNASRFSFSLMLSFFLVLFFLHSVNITGASDFLAFVTKCVLHAFNSQQLSSSSTHYIPVIHNRMIFVTKVLDAFWEKTIQFLRIISVILYLTRELLRNSRLLKGWDSAALSKYGF
jgi:hypothetical protein